MVDYPGVSDKTVPIFQMLMSIVFWAYTVTLLRAHVIIYLDIRKGYRLFYFFLFFSFFAVTIPPKMVSYNEYN